MYRRKKMKKLSKILILHGWNASPKEHWFPEARERFEKVGFRVESPELPGNYFPKKEEWVRIIESFKPDENWVLIGHSLGGVAILRYLEKAPGKIKQVILVATPYDAMKFGAIDNFFAGGFDWPKIKANSPQFDLVYEADDMAVPLKHGQKYAKKLGGKLHVLPGFDHFQKIDLDFLEKLIK